MISKSVKRIILIFAIFIFTISGVAWPAIQVSAEESREQKIIEDSQGIRTVRVGYFESRNFSEGIGDEAKSGYAYEYLQKVASFTGWKYEYVYGEWDDLLTMLKNGEIDVLPGVSYTEERANYISYPNQIMGFENYFIYANENQAFTDGDTNKFKGIKIGCNRNSMQEIYGRKWNEVHGNIAEIATYPGFTDLYAALNSHNVQAIIDTDNNSGTVTNLIPVTKIGQSDYYLAVSKSSPEVLEELNLCLDELVSKNPYYVESLHNKYFSQTIIRADLDKEEKAWLEEHGAIRVAYEKDFLSFCGYDEETGELKGALKVFVDGMQERYSKYGLEIEVVPYDTVGESLQALKNREVDVVFPLYESFFDAEKDDLLLSDKLAVTGMTAIVNNPFTFDEFADNRVAVSKDFNDIEWFVGQEYPNWTLVHYDSFDSCIAAMKKGEVDCVVESSYVYKTLVDRSTIKVATLSKRADIVFAVRRDDKILLSILNRAVATTPDSEILSTLTQYSDAERKTTFSDFAKDNLIALGMITEFIILVMLALTLKALSNAKKAKKAKAELASLYTEQEEKLVEITELNKKLERAIERADSANNAKTTFLFNMSHDIRTPMNAIIGFTNLLAKDIDDREKTKDYVKKIQNSNTVLLSLINNVLEMARIESGKMTLDMNYWNIEAFSDSIISVFADAMQKKNLEFVRIIDVKHDAILCDTTKVREIFFNILSNAMKYTPEGGRVSLKLTEVLCERPGYGKYVTVIEDNGIGMSPEYVEHIFDSFSRERTSTESQVEGSGLGMSIVKRLVDLMDGEIEVVSEVGRGTSIKVTLIHKLAKDSDRPVSEDNIAQNKEIFEGKRILLAEDNDLNAEIAETILEEAGFEVEHAKDGYACVDMIENAKAGYYDLVLMDIQMPKLNGYEATEKIRQLNDDKKSGIIIIAMTANAFEEDKQNAYEAGMNAHLSKPIQVDELIATLERLITA